MHGIKLILNLVPVIFKASGQSALLSFVKQYLPSVKFWIFILFLNYINYFLLLQSELRVLGKCVLCKFITQLI